jgi:hypothetical protein
MSNAPVPRNKVRYVVTLLSGKVFTSQWEMLTYDECMKAKARLFTSLSDKGSGVHEISPQRGLTVFIPTRCIETITMERTVPSDV